MRRRRNLFPKHSILTFFCAAIGFAMFVVVYVCGIYSPVKTRAVFDVVAGDSVGGVATRLANENLIAVPDVFMLSVRWHGGKIQRGQYDIPSGASAWRIGRMMARGQIATLSIVIPEGMTIKQIKQLLLASTSLTGAVECAADKSAPVCDLHDGDVFPDTYRVARGTSRLALLELMRKKMNSIEAMWRRTGRRAPAPLKSWNDILILASIVQKETPRASEMPIVASVYLNRLRKNMRLQADPTVVYALTDGLGDMQGGALLRGHLKTESPYNTYMHAGLPPAPIANVGNAAIRAVLNPADTNYLFFVADGRGGHRFSHSYEEHMKNHDDWRAIKKVRNSK